MYKINELTDKKKWEFMIGLLNETKQYRSRENSILTQ